MTSGGITQGPMTEGPMTEGPVTEGAVAELWRYPVKSMRGERIERAEVTPAGLVGDRAWAVVDVDSGMVGSAKHPRLWAALLQCQAWYPSPPTAGPPGAVAIRLPDGRRTGSDDPEVHDLLSRHLGRPVRLVSEAPEGNSYLAVWPEGVMPDEYLAQVRVPGGEAEGTLTRLANAVAAPPGTFFDVAALHVLTRSALRELGDRVPSSRFDVERYRPNVVLEGDVAPFVENGWPGAVLTLGPEVGTSVLIPTMRCIMTTLAQGDLPRDPGTLRAVSTHNRVDIDGLGRWSCVGAYASVTAPGVVAVGDGWSVTIPDPA